MLISFYGINNIGKTTQTKRLVQKLQELGYDAVGVKYPVYNMYPSGEHLNTLLRSSTAQPVSEEELQLWFVLNRYQFQPTLQGWLNDKRIVITEDYIGTGIAWGTTKGLSTEWLEKINEGLIKENLSILMDGHRFAKAAESGHLHEENEELVQRSRAVHLELGEKYGWEKMEITSNKDTTFERIWERVLPHLPPVG